MTDPNVVLSALRDELVALNLVRKPSVAGSLPPMHIEPGGGAPAPGERKSPETDGNLVITIRLSGGITPAPGPAAAWRTPIVDVLYRSDDTTGLKAGRILDAAIRNRLVGPATYGMGVQLPGLFVIQAAVFADLGPVSDLDGVRTELAKYAFEVNST